MPATLTVVYVERLHTGLIIGFSDGQAAVFSTASLYALLPTAESLPEPLPDE